VECLFNLRSERQQSIGRGGFVLRSGKRGEIRIGDGGDLGEVWMEDLLEESLAARRRFVGDCLKIQERFMARSIMPRSQSESFRN
jgi:hypothetical protein